MSNANVEDGVDGIAPTLRHATDDTVNYFNVTRKVTLVSVSVGVWVCECVAFPFRLPFAPDVTCHKPSERFQELKGVLMGV